MEVYPPDDLQPNEVGSGPTVSHLEQMKAWDDIANFEKVLQAACETNETHSDVNNCCKDDVLTSDHAVVNENPVCNTETKRKWEEEIADAVESNKHKLKRINNMVLSSGEVTIQLVGSTKDSCDNIPISNLLSTVVKPEPKNQSDDFPYKVSEKMPNEPKNSLKFIKLEPKTEIKDEIADFKTEVLQNESDIFMDVKNDSSLSEEKNFPNRIVSRDIKNDNCFTDELNSETKHEFYPPSKNILSYSLKDSDENKFQSDMNAEGTLSTEVPPVLSDKSDDLVGCTLSEDDGEKLSPLEINDITNSQDSYEKKKDKKERIEELCEKNIKKDDKLSKKKKFERCNIRDIKLEDELDAVTLSAQKEEQERIRRLQEAQMRALQERLQQIEVEKEALTQLFSQPPADAPNLFDSSSISETEPTNESKETTVKSENDVVLVESSDEDKKAKLQDILPTPIEENIIDISSSSSGNESDSDDSEKKDDDIMVLSDEGEAEGDGTAEDPNNSGAHTNDCFNLPDEEGRVLVNVGHPPEDPDIFLAPQIAKVIKPHQIGGIRFLYDNVVENLERYKSSSGFGCILAHSMGLGKTVQVVSFVDVFLRHTPATLVLCIVPINTIQNWKAEFDMWVPPSNSVDDAQVLAGEVRPRDYNVYTLNENFKTMAARAALIAEWRKQGGVLLMGYEMYRMLALRKMPKVPVKKSKRLKKQELCVEPETNEQIKKYMDEMYEHIVIPGPDLVICDEGHRIKNSLASTSMALKSIKTRRRVVLTGYPLQNNLLEYWCMVDFVRPNYLGSRAEFCNMFERPISNGQCIDSTPRDRQLMRFRSHVLHSLLVGFVQRRGHSVLRAVLPKKEEHVLLIRMTPIQRQLYKCFVKDLLYVQQATNPLKLFAVCCKIWNHPDILYKLLQEKKAQEDIDLDIDITMAANSAISSANCGLRKRVLNPSKKLMQRPLKALPRSLKPQPTLSSPAESLKSETMNYEQGNVQANEDMKFSSQESCKEDYVNSNQANMCITQNEYSQQTSQQSFQLPYSKSSTSQSFCTPNYQMSSNQQYSGNSQNAVQYVQQQNTRNTTQQHFQSQSVPQQQYSQTSLLQAQYGPQSQNQYSQGSSQNYSQVTSQIHTQFSVQSSVQQESINHPHSPQSAYHGNSTQSFSSQPNTSQFSQQNDVQKQYQNSSQQQFSNQSANNQDILFPQSPSHNSSPKFSVQSSQFSQSSVPQQTYNSQSSQSYASQQSYSSASKQHQFSEQSSSSSSQFASQATVSRPSTHPPAQQSYSVTNQQPQVADQSSVHHFSSQSPFQQSPPHSQFSQTHTSQQFSQPSPPLVSQQFPQQGPSYSQLSPSQKSSPTAPLYPQQFQQQSPEYSQQSQSQFQHNLQSFSQQVSQSPYSQSHQSFTETAQPYSEQSSPQKQFCQQPFPQSYMLSGQQYPQPSSPQQFSQQSITQQNFSNSQQQFTHQTPKFSNKQGQQNSVGHMQFSQQSPQPNGQKAVCHSPTHAENKQQNFNHQQTFSSQPSESQYSQSFPQQITSHQFSQQVSSVSQFSQQTASQPYSQLASQQFSQQSSQSAEQYNHKASSSQQYNQQINQSSQFSQQGTSQFTQSLSVQQYSPQSSKPQQFSQSSQNQLFPQPSTKTQFPQQTNQAQKSFSQQLSQASSSCSQNSQNVSQFPQQVLSAFTQQPSQLSQQYSVQVPQSSQYSQQPAHSPQQFSQATPQSPQQYLQQSTQSPQQYSQAAASSQQYNQQSSQTSQQYNQQSSQSMQSYVQQVQTPHYGSQTAHSPQQFPQQTTQPSQDFSQQPNQSTQFSQQTNQSSQQFNQQSSQSSQQFNQQSSQSSQQFNQQSSQSSQQFNQQSNQSSQQFNQQSNQSSQQFNQQSNQSSQFNQQTSQSSQSFNQQASQFGQSATQSSQFNQQTNSSSPQFNQQTPMYNHQPAQSSQSYKQPIQPSQQFNANSGPSSQQYNQNSLTSQQYNQQSTQSSQTYTQKSLQSSQQYSQRSTQSPHQYSQQQCATGQQYSQQTSQSSQQFSQQPVQSPQQFAQTVQSPQQFSQQTAQSPQQFPQQSSHSPQQFTQPSQSPQQFSQQPAQSPQQFMQQPVPSPQQFSQQEQFPQQTTPPQQFSQPATPSPQQFPQQPAPSPQQFSQQPAPSPQQFSQQPAPSPQQFSQQPAPSPQQFSQQPAPSPQQFSQQPAPSPQQFSQQPAPSPQQFSQNVCSPQQYSQSQQNSQSQQYSQSQQNSQSQQYSQMTPQQFTQQPQTSSSQSYSQLPSQQQFKQQSLRSGQSPQCTAQQQCLSNVQSQQFSSSFSQSSNQTTVKGAFQPEYQNQMQPGVSISTSQGLTIQPVNPLQNKQTSRGGKTKQVRSKSLCQPLLPQTNVQHPVKQPPSFSVQAFQNGSSVSNNASLHPLGQQTVKHLQPSGNSSFQPLNASIANQENFTLQHIKQDSTEIYPAKCPKAVLQPVKPQMMSPDSVAVQPTQLQQNQVKSESCQLESESLNNSNAAENAVLPFRDRMDSSISYEWAVPIMKDYVLGVLENSHKMMVLFVIIAETLHMGDKLLVFSQSLSTLDLLEHFLSKIQVPRRPDQSEPLSNETWCRNKNYFRLDGSTSAQEREKLINEFNRNDNVSLFLLSTRAGCLGINLVGANRIVVMDASWNPCHDAQAVCRIYRYGQKKQCHIYRLVTDNSLEKRIYDRQVNKQGMSDRVVDELNPESNFTWKDVTTLIQDDEDDGPVQELSKFASSYSDKVLKYLVSEMSPSLSKEPFEHESLLLDRKDLKLTKQEKRLAKQSYEMAKRANMINIRTTYTYLPAGTAGGGQFIINNKQCQWVGGTTIRVLPNQVASGGTNARSGTTATPITASPSLMSSLFKQGVMVQKLTMPSNVSIPVLTPGAPPVVIPAGQDVLVLRTPKGVYLRLPDGRIIAVQLPPSLLAKTQFRPNVVTHFRPAAPKGGNPSTTVINTPRGQSIGIIKQTLQCGGTVRYLGPRSAAGSSSQNTARSSAPEVIDLSDDDEPSIRKNTANSNTSANSSESESGCGDMEKLENSHSPIMLPGKQITIRKLSPAVQQNSVQLPSSKDKCELPQVLTKNKQITILPINPTNQQNRQKFAPQLAQPVRVQQMLLQPQQGKRKPVQKNSSKIQMTPLLAGKSIRPQITITQPTSTHSNVHSQKLHHLIHNAPKTNDILENIVNEGSASSPTKQTSDSPSMQITDRNQASTTATHLQMQNVQQNLQNCKNVSTSLSESVNTHTVSLPQSLASLTNTLNPNLQISSHDPEQSTVPDLLPQKSLFHQTSALHGVSSVSSLQTQISHNTVQPSRSVSKSPQLSKTESPVSQMNVQIASTMQSSTQPQTKFSVSQTPPSQTATQHLHNSVQSSFQQTMVSQSNVHNTQQKQHSEQSVSFSSHLHSSSPRLSLSSSHQPQNASQNQHNAPRKRKSVNKQPSKKSQHQLSLMTQNSALQPQTVEAAQQFLHSQLSDHHLPENHFPNFSHHMSNSDFQAFSNFTSHKQVSHIQHPQPLHPLQHSQEHSLPAHLQHMSHLYPMLPHSTGSPSLPDIQPPAPRAWPVQQPSVSSLHPFSQSSPYYSSGQESSQFSFQPSSFPLPPSSVPSNLIQSDCNVNAGSEGDKSSRINSSDL